MAQQNDKEYVNSIFIKKVYENGDNRLYGVGVKKKDFLKQIEALEENEKGFINLTMGTQKNDTDKMSLWVDNREPQASSSSKSDSGKSSKSTGSSKSTTKKKTEEEDDGDDLPF